MKSVIAQGATVAKAIDEAMQKAGMPQEFFIKILEEAQSGFLGFGAKKAKIALFFQKAHGKQHNLFSKGAYKNLFDNPAIHKVAEEAAVDVNKAVVEKKQPVSEPVVKKHAEQKRMQHTSHQAKPQSAKQEPSIVEKQKPVIKQRVLPLTSIQPLQEQNVEIADADHSVTEEQRAKRPRRRRYYGYRKRSKKPSDGSAGSSHTTDGSSD